MNYFLKLITESVKIYPGAFLVCSTVIFCCAVLKTWGWIGIAKMVVLYLSLWIFIIIGNILFDCAMWIINK
jgi:hypothetical protein